MKFSAVFLLVLVFAVLYVECAGRDGERGPRGNRNRNSRGNNGRRGDRGRGRDDRRGGDDSSGSSGSDESGNPGRDESANPGSDDPFMNSGGDGSNMNSGGDGSNMNTGGEESRSAFERSSSESEASDSSSSSSSSESVEITEKPRDDSGSDGSAILNLNVTADINIEELPIIIVVTIEQGVTLIGLEIDIKLVLAIFTNVEECLNLTAQANTNEGTVEAALHTRVCMQAILDLMLSLSLSPVGITELVEKVFQIIPNQGLHLIEDFLIEIDLLTILSLVGEVSGCLEVQSLSVHADGNECFKNLLNFLVNILQLVVGSVVPNLASITIKIEISDLIGPNGNILTLLDVKDTFENIPVLSHALQVVLPLLNGVVGAVGAVGGIVSGLLGGLLGK